MGLLKNILNNHHADKRFPQNQQHFHLILKKHFRLKIVNANTIEKNSKNFFSVILRPQQPKNRNVNDV